MRPIDADQLKDKLETFVLYRGNAFFKVTDMLHKVDECQTVDAIPVKQIEELEERYYSEGIEPCDLEQLLYEWRLDNDSEKVEL